MMKEEIKKLCAGCLKFQTKDCKKRVTGTDKACRDYATNHWLGRLTP